MAFFVGQARGVAAQAIDVMTVPAWRRLKYEANQLIPNVILGFDTLVDMYLTNSIDPQIFIATCRSNGFRIENFNEQIITPFRWNKTGELIDSYLGINPQYNRGQQDVAAWYIDHRRWVPTNDEAMEMFNRKFISEQCFDWIITKNTGPKDYWTEVYGRMRFQIPGVSDLITMAVRETFTPQIVEQYGYHKELPIDILPWMEKLGYGGETGITIPPGATTTKGNEGRTKAQWFDHFWWMHWQLPSLGVGYEMLHRLYPTSRYGPSPDVVNEQGQVRNDLKFTAEDMEILHKTQDYPEYWRKRLSAMSYLPLTRVDVRRMRQVGVFKDPVEVYHAYRAIGYDDRNAERLAQFTEELVKPKNRKMSQMAANEICTSYYNGYITWERALEEIKTLGFNEVDGRSQLLQCHAVKQRKEIDRRVKLIRRKFLKARIDEQISRQALERLGLTEKGIRETLAEWKFDFEWKYKELTLKQVKEGYMNDTISDTEWYEFLTTMGYTDKEQKVLTAEVDREEQQKVEKERTRGYSFFTPKTLLRLYNKTILEKDDIDRILKARGWKNEAIASFILDGEIE
jgi:hypothetical protein